MEKDDTIESIYGNGYKFGDILDASFKRLTMFDSRKPYRWRIFPKLLMNNFIATSSVIVRAVCFKKVGLFDPELPPVSDYDMWLRIAILYVIDYLDEPIIKYRESQHGIRQDIEKKVFNEIIVRNKILKLHPELKEKFRHEFNVGISKCFFELGYFYHNNSENKKAKGQFKKAFAYNSFNFRLLCFICFRNFGFNLLRKARYVLISLRSRLFSIIRVVTKE